MTKRHISLLVCAAALVGSGVAAAAPVSVPRVLLVHPGESIQAAVNSAHTGDTVLVLPGTYRESVRVTVPGLTLRGAGRRATVLEPAAKASNECAKRGNGICVTGTRTTRLTGVTVADLKLTGYSRAGLAAVGADRLTVRDVSSEKNGVWGFAEERSRRSSYQGDLARDNGDAGIFLANTITAEQGAVDTQGTVVAHNRLEGNRIGVTVRRLRNLTVLGNVVDGNCAGVFLVGDENKPRAGAISVRGNRVTANDKYCPKTARLPFLQGSGIVLTGVEKSQVTGNVVAGNSGTSPLSGGIVLFKSFVGAPSEHNRVSGNWLSGNAPSDLSDQEGPGHDNAFDRNSCRFSMPSGMC
ncbi:right-handed parallel beta-helix repeat-containing protein [Streptomyces sp. NPDC046985]|uniref:right-handed parallel beta-helix repeat-containing protein n=1 Tax=Streptomyces sp. NPDC046985 TaxID=3155377 RepID=UPI00340788D3